MPFSLIPLYDQMEALYRQPIAPQRFQQYLYLLQGDSKDDMLLPIAGFNPMGKAHVHQRLQELGELKIESVMEEAIREVNKKYALNTEIGVAFNLADDLKGGWTNRFTTDYDSKFKIQAFVNRRFCVSYFWTGEDYTSDLIYVRTLAYMYRTLYWLQHSPPATLEDHLKQEIFVQKNLNQPHPEYPEADLQVLAAFYALHQNTEDYSILFNFFYGDAASGSLGYPTYGVGSVHGFDYAKSSSNP
jgi:hypothetical protein